MQTLLRWSQLEVAAAAAVVVVVITAAAAAAAAVVGQQLMLRMVTLPIESGLGEERWGDPFRITMYTLKE
jgi:hypothetical protein